MLKNKLSCSAVSTELHENNEKFWLEMDTGKGSSSSSNSSIKVVAVHVVKEYRVNGGIALLNFNHGIGQRRLAQQAVSTC
jgi:hypothetical protein